MDPKELDRQDVLAQWAFDGRPILGRFHLWLEDVETDWTRGRPQARPLREISFVNGRIERLLVITAAVTALGTRLFGRFGDGAGQDKSGLNQVKKDADAISAYVMSECLWYLTRHLPENHAIMVCLGEGLMPKAGETPEMGANPQLGFGRVYARPEIARALDLMVTRLLNDSDYGWDGFYGDIRRSGVTVWGTAIDTLENTSRFAKGSETGALTILHLFDQPLHIVRPYEGYTGTLVLPKRVVEVAADKAILVDFRTPRAVVLQAIELAYPGIRRENIHVWTLGGKSRAQRLSVLWETWRGLNVHLVEEGWKLPSGLEAFTESGTYAPTYRIGTWQDEAGETHLFFCDGYAASAEALQAASLAKLLDLDASLVIFTSRFDLPLERERQIMRLDPDSPHFAEKLGADLDPVEYRHMIHEGKEAGLSMDKPVLRADDFFPEKQWEVLALSGYMGPDPYSGLPGVETVGPDTYRVTVRLSCQRAEKCVALTFRMVERSAHVFQPLLSRFLGGEDFRRRPVKISDSGRIRNELQTLCADALEYPGSNRIRVHFERIPATLIPPASLKKLREVLAWYKQRHPIWFSWLDFGD